MGGWRKVWYILAEFVNSKVSWPVVGEKYKYQFCSSSDETMSKIMQKTADSVECAFDRLKVLWVKLTRKNEIKLESVPVLNYAWCLWNPGYAFAYPLKTSGNHWVKIV